MNSTVQSIVVVVALSVIGAFLKHYFGLPAKAVFAGVIAFSAITLSMISSCQKAHLRRELRAMSADQIEMYVAECKTEGIEDPFEEVSEAELSWTGKIVDLVLGVTAAFGPPVVYHVVHGLPLSWNSEFTVWHLLWMGIGVAMYMSIRRRITTPFMTNTEPEFGAYADKPRGSN
jgi:hypothetical protein